MTADPDHDHALDRWASRLQKPIPVKRVPTLRTNKTRFRPWADFCQLIPLDPRSCVKGARTPNPIPLPARSTVDIDFVVLARTWWSVVFAYWGERDYTFANAFARDKRGKRKPLHRSKHYRLLTEAAARMRVEQIAPVEWVRFRCDIWVEMHQADFDYSHKVKIPPLTFVFGQKGFDQHGGWFDHYRASYAGGHLMVGPTYMKLIVDWLELVHECRINTRDPIVEIVDRHFPALDFEIRLQRAANEIAELQLRLNQLVARGAYVWKRYAPTGA